MDLVSKIMDFEAGEMSADDTIRLFGELVQSGMAWQLQGSYGRGAVSLIEKGYISRGGEVLKLVNSEEG